MASCGQTSVQPPQPWHSSGKSSGVLPTEASALNWQKSTHLSQASHLSGSKSGTAMLIVSSPTVADALARYRAGQLAEATAANVESHWA